MTIDPRLFLSRCADAVTRYWSVALSPLGAVALTYGALDPFRSKCPGPSTAVLAAGAILTVAGGVLSTRISRTNQQLSDQLAALTNQSTDRRAKRIFVILAAFNEEFQVELNFQLLRLGRERGLSLHVFCPSSNFSADDMRTSQEFILDNADQYSGGLLVASQFADDMVDELHEFAAKLLLPLVFVDHVPPASSEAPSPGNVRWVTVRDTTGGEKAVEATADFGIEPKRILVIAGPAKRDRQDAYISGIKQKWPACEVVTTVDGGFNRTRTQAIAVRLMREAACQGKMFDVVFCTSDSMTLGCLDAFEQIEWKNYVNYLC